MYRSYTVCPPAVANITVNPITVALYTSSFYVQRVLHRDRAESCKVSEKALYTHLQCMIVADVCALASSTVASYYTPGSDAISNRT